MIDRTQPVPLYYQLKMHILKQIKRGDLAPDDQLPTEDELAQKHGVSKATVRQALSELATAGLVRREQGRGTFVSSAKMDMGPRELTGFTQEMHMRGKTAASRVLAGEIVEAQDEVARKLNLIEGAPVFCLKRLRLADGVPMGIQTAYVPMDLAPSLADGDFEHGSLYEFLASRHGLVPARAKEVHAAVSLDTDTAEALQVAEGSPALACERITHLESGRPLELVTSIMRGDRYEIVLDLVNTAGR